MKRGLVSAGGGVAGIAWEIGVLRGIEELDPPLAAALVAADVVIGTSAGSTVAAQITGGAPLAELYAAQLSEISAELEVRIEMDELIGRFSAALGGSPSPEEFRRRIGALAIEAPTVDEATRRAAIEARLAKREWPDGILLLVAVDVETGKEVIFDRRSGVPLVDAVAASCAVPGVWPPVTIAGHRYMDGGVRSSANADLAAGCDRVVVLSPAAPNAPSLGTSTLGDELRTLEPAKTAVVYANAAAVAAFGVNPLSPETRKPSAEAGLEQGRNEAGRLAAIWS